MGNILVSFLYMLLNVAVVVFIAVLIWWVITGLFKIALDANVYKWGKIVVVLICLIIVVTWLLSLLGMGPGLPSWSASPRLLR
jgi:hypothetical protein